MIDRIVELVEERVGHADDTAPEKRLARMVIAKMTKRMGIPLKHAAEELGLTEATVHYYAHGRPDREGNEALDWRAERLAARLTEELLAVKKEEEG